MKATSRIETDNHIAVDIVKLQAMLGMGRNNAAIIGEKAGAVIKIGRRKLYNVKKVQAYIDSITENGGSDYE